MNTKGFTLLEVVIGLFIAVVAAVSVGQVIASTNKVVAAGRNTFIATNLAREGVELTRVLRDNTWFSNIPRSEWMSKYGICPEGQEGYAIDPNIVRTIEGNVVPATKNPVPLYIQKNGEWNHEASGQTTPFQRLVTVDCANVDANPAYVSLTSTVHWRGVLGEDKSVAIKELIYNWLP